MSYGIGIEDTVVDGWGGSPNSIKGTMKILALDPATKFGFAHSCGISGTWDLSVRRDESAGMRLIRLRGKLAEIGGSVGIDLLVFEAARHAASNGALIVQTEFQSVVKVYCADNGIEYRGYSPSEIKKHATGKGNASKEMMLAEARRRWPDKRMDDNEADALLLLDLAQSTLEPAT